MSVDEPGASRPLPERPNLRHLKDQAKDMLKAGEASSLSDAQFKVARVFGFASWPRLKAHIESLLATGQLKRAIDSNDFDRVKELMRRDPSLHGAPIGYGKDGPLTWVAECRVPWEAPVELLLAAGGATRYDAPPVLALLRDNLESLTRQIDADPQLVHRRFPELDCGMSGGRRLALQGGTLLHVAAEFGNVDAAALLLKRGADVNARATIDANNVGDQTAIFHAATQYDDAGLPVMQLLIEHGADLTLRVRLPGDYERPGEIVECTLLGYALLFGGSPHRATVHALRQRGAVE